MPRLYIAIFSLLFLLSTAGYAQQSYVFQHLTTKEGLASDVITSLFQDSKGFYWVGTENGLQKFDGKNFINLPATRKRTNGQILIWPDQKPVEDAVGNIWAYSQGFIYVYHPNGNVSTVTINDDTTNNAGSDISSYCIDEWGTVWIATWLNIYKYESTNNTPTIWLHIGPRPDRNSTRTLIYDAHKKSFWLAKDRMILLIDGETKRITQPFSNPHAHKADIPEGYYITMFSMDSKQNLWFSAWNGLLYKYNTVTYQKNVYDWYNKKDKSENQINRSMALCFEEDTHGLIWLGALYSGLSYYDERNDAIRQIPADNKSSHSLHYKSFVSALCNDKEGNILVGTDKGLNIFNPYFQQFTTMGENNSTDPFPKTEVIQVFEGSNKAVYAGTWGNGWLLYTSDFRLKKQYYNNPETAAADEESRKNFVWSFAEDPEGKIWIGYQYGLLGIFDTATKHIQYMEVPQFNKKTIRVIQCDAAGNMWFGLQSGVLCKWDKARRRFVVYNLPAQFKGEPAASITSMFINLQGEIWVSTYGNGFYCFDAARGKIIERFTAANAGLLFDNEVNALTQLNDSLIGVSTGAKGFLLFNKKEKTLSSFTVKDGLPTNEVYGLAQDVQKNLWIATRKGMARMNSAKKQLISFSDEDGILNADLNANFTVLHDGRMVVPTSTGMVYFSPDQINRLPPPPAVKVTGFKVFNQALSIDSILFAGNNTMQLNHNRNFITITYASISLLGGNSTRYFYQLSDVDKDWIDAGTQRFASYTKLSPGHYTFRIKCRNRDGILSTKVTELNIIINPPWWRTWWAYALYAAIVGSILFLLYRNHIRQFKRKQRAQLKEMVATQEEERKRISRDLHDDVGTKLSALKLFITSLQEKAAQTNHEEIQALAESSGQFISEAVQDVRQLLLNLSPTVLEEFGYTTAIEGLVNKINATRQIHFNLVVFGMSEQLKKEYELALYRITQELINNVLKHAGARQVSLQIGRRDGKIILMIEDDGKGFDVNNHKGGYGFSNLEARTKLMSGTMVIDSMPGKGTSVLIEVPYQT